ncbi:MAG: TetR/AcrR family transcriptional regulator [Caldilineaceae bacterium]|nr:TetR/AcrR family transcriptional regulator [Caldilineaceae bacterium]
MARIVKEYDERYQEFLDVAQALFQQRGYEQVTVRQIIDAVGVAKGTFYHYFDAKSDLLDAIVGRSMAGAMAILRPLVDDPNLDAVAKFDEIFARLGSWKTANKEFILNLMRALYRDENVLMRTKMQRASATMMIPLLAQVIQQGVEEGLFAVDFPDQAAEIVLNMGTALSQSIVDTLLESEDWSQLLEPVMTKIHAYERSIERVLHAPEGSLAVIDKATMAQWFA